MELENRIRTLYSVNQLEGCTEQEIQAARDFFGALPKAVEDFWRAAGRTKQLACGQDDWQFPAFYEKWGWPKDSKDLSLLCENQYVCEAAVLQKDFSLPDPPVYTRMAADDGPWQLSAPAVSDFLEAALTYEAVWSLPYSPDDFFSLTEEELEIIRSKLTKHSAVLRNWLEMEVTFYSSRPDNLLVVMDLGDEYQALYGGVTQESYQTLLEVMEGLGEPL